MILMGTWWVTNFPSPGVAPAFPLLGHGTCHWVHRGWLFTSRCLWLCLTSCSVFHICLLVINNYWIFGNLLKIISSSGAYKILHLRREFKCSVRGHVLISGHFEYLRLEPFLASSNNQSLCLNHGFTARRSSLERVNIKIKLAKYLLFSPP